MAIAKFGLDEFDQGANLANEIHGLMATTIDNNLRVGGKLIILDIVGYLCWLIYVISKKLICLKLA